jgi:hypothetical protein
LLRIPERLKKFRKIEESGHKGLWSFRKKKNTQKGAAKKASRQAVSENKEGGHGLATPSLLGGSALEKPHSWAGTWSPPYNWPAQAPVQVKPLGVL